MDQPKKTCQSCNNEYDDHIDNKFQNHIKHYCKYLGACSDKCFYDLPLETRNKMFMAAIYQDNKK